ncbi:MAG: NB-ARC domain-containing protein, partial [Candidatus Promineifilaceae bacterium]|nr:NB-ARC domain-containing protein [Candidatus Promineifilaceae bacterium]
MALANMSIPRKEKSRDDTDLSFGAWLRQRRRQLDLTQKELAQLAACGLGTLRKIEQGTRRPSKDLAASIGAAVQVPEKVIADLVAFARGDPFANDIPVPIFALERVPPTPPAIPQQTINHHTSRIPHNLPPQPTPFVGRLDELQALRVLITNQHSRLVTITGPGGIGKTRLALTLAEMYTQLLGEQPARFPDGVYFLSFSSTSEVDDIIPTIAEALDLRIQIGHDEAPSQEQQVLNYLRDKRMLLVLDNFEHLLDGVDSITTIMKTAVTLHILVTSRERLYLQAEQVFPIRGLAYPQENEIQALEIFPAVQLFLLAARRISPCIGEEKEEILGMARICRQVEGMPLAIELAAGWVDTLSLRDISAEIEDSLCILEINAHDLPRRHRSFQAAMDISWQFLGPAERKIFPQLTVFRDGFSRAAAEAIVDSGEFAFSLQHLSKLVNKSWLRYERDRDQYKIHDLLRQYGEEKLAEQPDQNTAVLDRYAAYFCEFLSHHEADLKGGRQMQALREIEGVRQDLAKALAWATTNQKYALVYRSIFALGCFYGLRLGFLEGASIFNQLEHYVLQQPDDEKSKQQLLAALLVWQAAFSFDEQRARQIFTRAWTLLDTPLLAGTDIDWDRAARYERELRHDVMAHVSTLGDACPQAHPVIHLGATSCFVTDNADLMIMRDALKLVASRLASVIVQLGRFVMDTREVACLGMTH